MRLDRKSPTPPDPATRSSRWFQSSTVSTKNECLYSPLDELGFLRYAHNYVLCPYSSLSYTIRPGNLASKMGLPESNCKKISNTTEC